jgi:hypothetical protein
VTEFYDEREPERLGDPALDPPMTVRVHPDDDPFDPAARRVIKTDDPDPEPWQLVTGYAHGFAHPLDTWYADAHVVRWPVTHPIQYTTAHRHAAADDARQGRGPGVRGDLGVDAFKGGA